MQYFSTCDISEFVFRYPHGCVPVSSWYIQSIVVDVLSPVVTLVRSGGMRLYRAIFVIYAYDRILHDKPSRTNRSSLCTLKCDRNTLPKPSDEDASRGG